MPQPLAGRGACAQAPGTAGSHRGRSGQDCRGHAARAQPAAWRAGHCAARGARHRALPHGQAFGADDHRHDPGLGPQARGHRRRGRAGRAVRDSHQPARAKLDAPDAVAAYKSLAQVERAFRSMKTVDLNVRPVFHYSEQRVRAHVFLCMLAYYVEWHMRAP
ncbi:MAG: transposase [Sterolibacteriaceae bacterium]|nr:transposase [Sterolibacteriaceae bacterium]